MVGRQNKAPLNKFPLWRYILIVVLVILAFIYALPNIFGESPAVQVSPKEGKPVTSQLVQVIRSTLKTNQIQYSGFTVKKYSLGMRFKNTVAQMKAQDVLKSKLGDKATVAISLAPNAPKWLLAIGAFPMRQGLDLRGGLYFLIDVDMHSVITNNLNNFASQLRTALRKQVIRYSGITVDKKKTDIQIQFRSSATLKKAEDYIQSNYPDLTVTQMDKSQTVNSKLKNVLHKVTNTKKIKKTRTQNLTLLIKLSKTEANQIRTYAVGQTVEVLRNRVDQLGVAEASVAQQGKNRVAIQLPGIQDAAHAKDILGGTATVKVMMVNEQADLQNAINTRRNSRTKSGYHHKKRTDTKYFFIPKLVCDSSCNNQKWRNKNTINIQNPLQLDSRSMQVFLNNRQNSH
jgi:preprotein translocase subunit SecD